jgi:hypothetical protein
VNKYSIWYTTHELLGGATRAGSCSLPEWRGGGGCLPKALYCQNEAAEFRRGQHSKQDVLSSTSGIGDIWLYIQVYMHSGLTVFIKHDTIYKIVFIISDISSYIE